MNNKPIFPSGAPWKIEEPKISSHGSKSTLYSGSPPVAIGKIYMISTSTNGKRRPRAANKRLIEASIDLLQVALSRHRLETVGKFTYQGKEYHRSDYAGAIIECIDCMAISKSLGMDELFKLASTKKEMIDLYLEERDEDILIKAFNIDISFEI